MLGITALHENIWLANLFCDLEFDYHCGKDVNADLTLQAVFQLSVSFSLCMCFSVELTFSI
jgi:hypothetical protein